MDKNIYNNSKKFLAIILIICIAFLILIVKAFDYIPDKTSGENINRLEDINTPSEPQNTEETASEEMSEPQKENVGLNIDLSKAADFKEPEVPGKIEVVPTTGEELAVIEEEAKPVELTPEQKVAQIFSDADKYKESKQYMKALEEYQKVALITNNTKSVAKSYEEIAAIYASVKRYGTALSFAQKAYNMSPSSSREILLARLYYKTGDIEKATRRVNNVLQRDFSAD